MDVRKTRTTHNYSDRGTKALPPIDWHVREAMPSRTTHPRTTPTVQKRMSRLSRAPEAERNGSTDDGAPHLCHPR